MHHCSLIHSSTDGHLGCFHSLAVANNAEMNIGVLRFFWISVLGSFWYIPRRGIAGSKGSSIFNFLWKLHTVFPQWLHQSAFPPTAHKGSPFSTSSPALVVCWFIDDSHSDRCDYLIVVLISISLMISGFEHFFICLLVTCMSLEKCLFRSFAQFLIGLFVWC